MIIVIYIYSRLLSLFVTTLCHHFSELHPLVSCGGFGWVLLRHLAAASGGPKKNSPSGRSLLGNARCLVALVMIGKGRILDIPGYIWVNCKIYGFPCFAWWVSSIQVFGGFRDVKHWVATPLITEERKDSVQTSGLVICGLFARYVVSLGFHSGELQIIS